MKLANLSLFQQACYINGQWVSADSGNSFPVMNPADGSILGHVPQCTEIETKRAINAAYQAWQMWRKLSAQQRSEKLWAWAQLIEENKKDLATIITFEQGKPLAEALAEVDYANACIKWFAEEGRRIYGDVLPSNKRKQHLIVMKESIGVVAAITPWNFPSAMITRKIAPALAVGCTIVVKPAEDTPFSALALAVLAEKAGIPAGVFNVITGVPEKIGAELTANSLVRKLSFTGSTRVGKLLMAQCANTVKKLSLELGGNAPFIIFDDADVDAAVHGAMLSKFRNSGQTCVCANRIYAQEGIYEKFVKKLSAAISQLKVGHGVETGVQQGPLINATALKKVQTHVDDAIKKGAHLVCGGKSHALGGLFFEPTLLTHVNDTMLISQEETFGPVAAIFKFKHEDEVIEMANATQSGLASYFYSQHMERIWRVSEALQYGMVGVNTGIISTEVAPFGGMKESGIGREGSKYGVEPYLEIKYLCMGAGE